MHIPFNVQPDRCFQDWTLTGELMVWVKHHPRTQKHPAKPDQKTQYFMTSVAPSYPGTTMG